MHDDAQKIFDYLPIRSSQNEIDYRDHIWTSTIKLYKEENEIVSTRSFSIMPFHILFMFVLQYKVLRIKQQRPVEYIERIKKYQKDKIIKEQLLNTNSVYDFSLIGETSLAKLFSIIGLSSDNINRIISLVTHRNNNVAHAKGGFIFDADQKIIEYLGCLSEVQKCMEVLNNEVTKSWLSEIEDEDDLEDFKERKLADSYICNEDFNSGDMLLLVNNASIPFNEWYTIKSENNTLN